MMRTALVVLAFALLIRNSAAAAETRLIAPTSSGPVAITLFTAPGNGPRPTVLILHGRSGVISGDSRYAADLAAAGVDAWIFSYYTPADEKIMRGDDRTRRTELYNARFRAWMKVVSDVAGVALAQAASSGRLGLLGFSNGGFLAVGTAAIDPRVGALVVFYGGIPGGLTDEITRLPPVLALHGDADRVIPIAEGRALIDRAKSLGGPAELITYAGANHGFDIAESAAAADARSRAVNFLHRQLVAP